VIVNDTVQPTLDEPEWFVPVPLGAAHYVAAVQNKPGELEALRQAPPETWSRFTPLMQIVGPRKPPEAYRGETVDQWVKRVADAVGQHTCFLDILRLRAGHPVMTKGGTCKVLAAIHAAARKRHLMCVPVLKLSDRHAEVGLIRDAVASGGRGVALRFPLLTLALREGQTSDSLIKEALAAVEVEVSGADLLIDLGFLSPDQDVYAEDVARSVDELVGIGEWRSVAMLGTSMPSMLGGVVAEGTVGVLRRREWDLWSALKRIPPQRLPTYGDYVVQHPHPPQDDSGGGPNMRANIRYTTENMTLVARGRRAYSVEGREQYRGLCRMLVERPEFAGADYSSGDTQIAECASGAREPGSNNAWRGASSSHHLRLVTEQLSG
jgi:Beta protein